MLSELSVQLFTPCLLYSNMVETLDPVILFELWLTPIVYFFYGIISLTWVYFSGNALDVKEDYSRLLSVAVFFANTNTLPVSLLKTILFSPSAEFMFKDKHDTTKLMAARGVSYAIMFATFNNLLRWSLGSMLISGGKPRKNTKTINSSFHSLMPTPSISPYLSGVTPILTTTNTGKNPELPNFLLPDSAYNNRKNPSANESSLISNTVKISYHNSNVNTHLDATSSQHDSSSCPSTPLLLNADSPIIPKPSILETAYSKICYYSSEIISGIRSCLSMPVIAILLAIITVSIPQAKKSLLDITSVYNVMFSAIDMCGDACIPLTILTLGGQLGQMNSKKRNHRDEDQFNESFYFKCKKYFSSLYSKFFRSPEDDVINPNDYENGSSHPIKKDSHTPKLIITSSSYFGENSLSNRSIEPSKSPVSNLGTTSNLHISESIENDLSNQVKPNSNPQYNELRDPSHFDQESQGFLNYKNQQTSIQILDPNRDLTSPTSHNQNIHTITSSTTSLMISNGKKVLKSNLKSNKKTSYQAIDESFDFKDKGELGILSSNSNHTENGKAAELNSASSLSSAHLEPLTINQLSNKKTSMVNFASELQSRMRQISHDNDSDSDTDSIVLDQDKNKGIFIVLVGRFLVVPVFAVLVLVFLIKYFPNKVTLLSTDPVFLFTLLVLSATPPAINLITVVQSTGLYENDAANLLMWSYLVGIFTISIQVGFFLLLTDNIFNP
ncbi:putative transporter [Smittium culicis]|uniref:Putative transporter n=1 Tax=Smittium culicis TaxID=133412 RepID=A0A1R1Y3Q9_9FUNG|nr:putative transporter [Smittium culicis]